MRRLALLLAASVLGTGCIVTNDTCNSRTVSVGWPSFLLANGVETTSCSAAGVRFVDVFMDDAPVGEFDCTQGGVSVLDVPSGSHRFTVEGLDPAKTILLRDEPTVSGSGCGEQFVNSRPAEGTVTLDYTFTPTNVCTAGGSYIWFSMFDQIANTVAAVADETANTTAYVCGTPISFPMPVGPFTLQRVEEVVPSAGAYVPTATNCTATSFSVNAATESVLAVALVDGNTFCPAAAAPAGTGRAKALATTATAVTAKP
ncbi:hypothetical protein [Anaeromyxobacter oryzae]|uniref:Lipoprotein n=1 Tax=Anaeromyxobacter oryzae TaxID=2918170 RepID=A0ABM7WXR7_9BACT|nr:hypothetical protein [Anaeromyxobacter oryzae]BDG04319.1 hypothetical protein AMOR_33150 [Anaeromyxobacter oryzae]